MIEYQVKVYEDRTKWYLNGQLHREDGPAVEYVNGDKSYWLDGKRHRENGPAIEHVNGGKSYWINNINLTEKEFLRRTSPPVEPQIISDFKEVAEKYGYELVKKET